MDGLPISVLVIGCGNMGASHAKAYEQHPGFAICGLVSRGSSKKELNETLIADYPLFADYQAALEATKPDAVCISTYPDTHEAIALKALEMGCHLFVEKPLATTVEGCNRIIEVAKNMGKHSCGRLYFKASSHLDQVYSDRSSIGKTFGDADEFKSAKPGLYVGGA